MSNEPTLVIKNVSLPDLDDPGEFSEYGIIEYGRFAVRRDGSYWFGDARSTNPPDTDSASVLGDRCY